MADNAQKTPFVTTQQRFATNRALAEIRKQGRSLPCSVVAVNGSILTVKFEVNASPFTLPQVTIPLAGCEYARPPIQVGCKGYAQSADAYLGGMSGLGGGVADLSQRANLTALVFVPIANTGWQSVDGNAYTIYGPNGVVLRDSASAATFTLTPSEITMSAGGHTLTINASGISLDGKLFASHEHTGVQGGPSNTGPVA